MTTIIIFLSFRRGVGRSRIAANVAALLASQGQRVGLVDGHLRSPSLSSELGLAEAEIGRTINDYLRGKCEIEQAAYPIASGLPGGPLWLVPASSQAHAIAEALRYGYNGELLAAGLVTLADTLALDLLLVELHAGLDEEIIRLMALADTAAIVLRHDQSDYQGTAVMVDVARKLAGPRPLLIANELPQRYDAAEVAERLAQIYGCAVAGVLPHSDALQTPGQQGLFVARHPERALITMLRTIAVALAGP